MAVRLSFAGLALMLSLQPATARPAYCSKPRLDEAARAVCASPELAAQDEIMSALYARLLDSVEDKAAVRRDQRAWLRVRDETVNFDGTTPVLSALYERRIRYLRGRLDRPGAVYRDRLAGGYGQRHPVCIYNAKADKDVCGSALDTIDVWHLDPARAYVMMATVSARTHLCNFEGEGRWQGDVLLAEARPDGGDPSAERCRLELSFDRGGVSTRTLNEVCSEHCGAGASLDGETMKLLPNR